MRGSVLIIAVIAVFTGCGPEIGDECSESLDCAIDGTRICDSTQPDGYCLIPGCRADECPEEAICVRFGLDEQARTFCMRHCETTGDCRSGYECFLPVPDPVDGEEGDPLSVPTEIIDDAPQSDSFCAIRQD